MTCELAGTQGAREQAGAGQESEQCHTAQVAAAQDIREVAGCTRSPNLGAPQKLMEQAGQLAAWRAAEHDLMQVTESSTAA